eukprot:2262177-Pyramimonas_sp.AAC.1
MELHGVGKLRWQLWRSPGSGGKCGGNWAAMGFAAVAGGQSELWRQRGCSGKCGGSRHKGGGDALPRWLKLLRWHGG